MPWKRIALLILAFFIPFIIAYATAYSSQNVLNPLLIISSTSSNDIPSVPIIENASTSSNDILANALFLISSTSSKDLSPVPVLSSYSTQSNDLLGSVKIVSLVNLTNLATYTPPTPSYSLNSTNPYPNSTLHISITLQDNGAPVKADSVNLIIKSPEKVVILSTYMTKISSNPLTFSYDWKIPSNAPPGPYNITFQIMYSGDVWKTQDYPNAFSVVSQPKPVVIPQQPMSVGGGNITVGNLTNITKVENITKVNKTFQPPNMTGGGGGGGGGGFPVGGIAMIQQTIQQITRKNFVNITNPLGISGAYSTAQAGASSITDNLKIIFLGKDHVIFENKECTRFRFRIEEISGTPTVAILRFENLSAETTKAILSDSSRVDVLSGSAVVRVAVMPYESIELDVYTPDGPQGSYLAQLFRYLRLPAFWDQYVGNLPVWLFVLAIILVIGYIIYSLMRRGQKSTYRFYR